MGVWDIIYLVCMFTGLVYTLITLFFGDAASEWMAQTELPVLQPILLVSGLTAFGASGFLLTRFSSFSPLMTAAIAVLAGIVIAVAAYFTWIKPMENAESSVGYSMQQLTGMIGEVLTTVPADGLGEVLITMVSGRTNHMAASFDKEMIREGTRVVVIDVRDHVLYVAPLQNSEDKESM